MHGADQWHQDSRATRTGAAAALGLAGAGTAAAAAVLLGTQAADQLAVTGDRAPLPELVPLLATAAAAAVTAWLAGALLLGAVAALPRLPGPAAFLPRLARRLSPRLAPQVAALLAGAVVAATGSSAAHAAAVPMPWLEAPERADAPAVEEPGTLLPRPDFTPQTDSAGPAHERGGGTIAGPPPQQGVVVAPGDTLWDLAAAHLPPGASEADIARAWPRWYARNRDVIGPDPDLLRPGQRLQPPTGAAPGTVDGQAGR